MALVLYGYQYSVYFRIARLVLEEKGLLYKRVEVNPFGLPLSNEYLRLHPFGRVPTLVHDGFVMYETGAITRYIDRTFLHPPLQPQTAGALARMDQVISVIDSYAYWPLVRQVFAHGVLRPRLGHDFDKNEVAAGLTISRKVLGALEALIDEGPFLIGADITLADLHLAPMLCSFVEAPEGLALLLKQPKLSRWWTEIKGRPSLTATDPGLQRECP